MRYHLLTSAPMHGALMILPMAFRRVESAAIARPQDVLELLDLGGYVSQGGVADPVLTPDTDSSADLAASPVWDPLRTIEQMARILRQADPTAILLDTHTGQIFKMTADNFVGYGGNILSLFLAKDDITYFGLDRFVERSDHIELPIRVSGGQATCSGAALRACTSISLEEISRIVRGCSSVVMDVPLLCGMVFYLLWMSHSSHEAIAANRISEQHFVRLSQMLQLEAGQALAKAA